MPLKLSGELRFLCPTLVNMILQVKVHLHMSSVSAPEILKKFINLCEHLLTFTDLAHATFVTVFSNKMGVNICLSSKCNIRKSNYSREVTTNVLINVFLPKTD